MPHTLAQAGRWLQIASEQLEQGGLAAAVHSDNTHARLHADTEVDALQYQRAPGLQTSSYILWRTVRWIESITG
jgi:hypothetical protein